MEQECKKSVFADMSAFFSGKNALFALLDLISDNISMNTRKTMSFQKLIHEGLAGKPEKDIVKRDETVGR